MSKNLSNIFDPDWPENKIDRTGRKQNQAIQSDLSDSSD